MGWKAAAFRSGGILVGRGRYSATLALVVPRSAAGRRHPVATEPGSGGQRSDRGFLGGAVNHGAPCPCEPCAAVAGRPAGSPSAAGPRWRQLGRFWPGTRLPVRLEPSLSDEVQPSTDSLAFGAKPGDRRVRRMMGLFVRKELHQPSALSRSGRLAARRCARGEPICVQRWLTCWKSFP